MYLSCPTVTSLTELIGAALVVAPSVGVSMKTSVDRPLAVALGRVTWTRYCCPAVAVVGTLKAKLPTTTRPSELRNRRLWARE